MYYKIEENQLILKQAPSAVELFVPIDIFQFISSIVYNKEDNYIFITGVKKGDQLPNLKNNLRGDLRLYRWEMTEGGWRQVCDSYAHDPVPVPGTKDIAFYSGNGLCIINEVGNLKIKYKMGRFNWGPPSLSISPDGTKIAMIKWRGDNRKLFVYNIPYHTGMLYKISCYRYCWYDDNSILYHLAHSLKLLLLESGKSQIFLGEIFKPCSRERIEYNNFHNLVPDNIHIKHIYDDVKVINDRVYFVLTALGTRKETYDFKLHGLFSINKDKKELKLEYLCERGEKIAGFDIDNDGSIALIIESYQDCLVIGRKRVVVGNKESLLYQGWDIMSSGLFAEFGFHYYGQFE